MTETTTISASDVLCNLKAIVTELECQQKQQLYKQFQEQLQKERQQIKCQEKRQERESKTPAQQPMFLMIPIEDTKKCEGDKRSHSDREHDNHCSSKGGSYDNGKSQKTHDKKNRDRNLELKGAKSRELRAGILYTSCGCLHRDGLQDSCPRSECQGQPECLVKPWAVCPPGIRCRIRHPETYGAPPNPDALTF